MHQSECKLNSSKKDQISRKLRVAVLKRKQKLYWHRKGEGNLLTFGFPKQHLTTFETVRKKIRNMRASRAKQSSSIFASCSKSNASSYLLSSTSKRGVSLRSNAQSKQILPFQRVVKGTQMLAPLSYRGFQNSLSVRGYAAQGMHSRHLLGQH